MAKRSLDVLVDIEDEAPVRDIGGFTEWTGSARWLILRKGGADDPEERGAVALGDGTLSELDEGTFLVHDHATATSLVGVVWIKKNPASPYRHNEFVVQAAGAQYPFRYQTAGGTVRFKHDSNVEANYVRDDASGYGWDFANIQYFEEYAKKKLGNPANIVKRHLSYDSGSNSWPTQMD